jgi:hypothetical protein
MFVHGDWGDKKYCILWPHLILQFNNVSFHKSYKH